MNFSDALNNALSKLDNYEFKQAEKQALLSYGNRLSVEESLREYAEELYMRIFESDENILPTKTPENDGLEQGMLFAMIYLARYELLGQTLEKKGIPAKYASPAIWHYKNLFERSFNCYGKYGFSGMYRDGMVQYIKPKTFRLGRLCFEMNRFNGTYEVYKNLKDETFIPIATAGIPYLNNGKQAPSGYERETFITTFEENKQSVKGYTFTDDGRLVFEQIALNLSECEKVLSNGDDVLSVHIPGNDKLTSQSVHESFEEARSFFEKYYPEKQFKAFVCSSWLLDTGLSRIMKKESNILRFQENFRIVLSRVNTFALYWNIFGIEEFIPICELVPKNSFQQEILNLLNSGEYLYSGNGFIII